MKNGKRKSLLLAGLAVLVLFMACTSPSGKKAKGEEGKAYSSFVTTAGQRFIDSSGRQIILHGINVINKDPGERYLCGIGEDVYRKLYRWGFNVVRLGILWDGLEPESGVYDEEMFRCVDQHLAWAAKYGVYVILDMHQDLYSVKYSDGAPEWATLDEGLLHQRGALWSDAYLLSPAIQRAFDNFWKNAPAPDGIGIQDHYAALWKKIAERYAGNPTVIGYDLMNEPFPGSQARQYVKAMVEAYGRWLATTTGKVLSEEELIALWSSPEGKEKVFETLRDTSVYRQVLFSVKPLTRAFEEGPLHDFYTRVGKAIREVDTNHILFLEHNYFCNPGVPSSLRIPLSGPGGTPDRKVAYAPHGYDLLVDTRSYGKASPERVTFLLGQIDRTGKRLNIPVLVGEWGAFHSKEKVFVDHTRLITSHFARTGTSETFWAYYEGIENYPFFRVLIHPYPMAVSGELQTYAFDIRERTFRVSWKENGNNAPSLFFVPGITTADAVEIEMIPEGEGFGFRFLEGGKGATLSVRPLEKEEKRELKINY